ncbi:MAG: YncE family protein [Acidobacteriota bacterium]
MKLRFALLLLLAGVGAGFRANPETSEPRNLGTPEPRNLRFQSPDLLYVCIQDDAKIAVVDMKAKSVVTTIDVTTLGFPATAKPHYVVVEPDGSFWYVSLIGANTVAKFDRENRIVGKFEMETPGMMAFDGKERLVVTRSMSAVNPPKRIAVLERATMKGEELDVVFPRPHPIAVANGYAYTGSLGVNQIATVELSQDKVEVLPIAGPTHSLVQFTISPDRKTLLGSTDVSGQLLVFSLAQPAKPALVKSIDVGKMAFDPVFTPDGKFAWVPVKSSNEVVVIDAASWKEVARITGEPFKQPHQVVFSADGATAFVTNNNKMDHMADPAHADHVMPAGDGTASLAVVDVKTRRVEKAIPLGKNLTGMGARARM